MLQGSKELLPKISKAKDYKFAPYSPSSSCRVHLQFLFIQVK